MIRRTIHAVRAWGACVVCLGLCAATLLASGLSARAEGGTETAKTLRYSPSAAWGSSGVQPGSFNSLAGVAIDTLGNVYVADSHNHRIQIFSNDGILRDVWGKAGMRLGQLRYPSGVAVDRNGYVYVVDSGNNRIQVFSNNGIFIRAWGRKGSKPGQFQTPIDIAIDRRGDLYITDTNNNRIQVFSPTGQFLRMWGSFGLGEGQLMYPQGIAVSADDEVYVAELNAVDDHSAMIHRFTIIGEYLGKWCATAAVPDNVLVASDVAVGPDGRVYVADLGHHQVVVYARQGTFLTRWGEYGTAPGAFSSPKSIAVDADGNVFVTEIGVDRIQKFSPGPPRTQPDTARMGGRKG